MALKVELKPGERILIGDCVVTNSDQRTRLLIEGRGADPAREGHHDGRARQHAGQAHLSGGAADVHRRATRSRTTKLYFALMRDIVQAAPSTWPTDRRQSIIIF